MRKKRRIDLGLQLILSQCSVSGASGVEGEGKHGLSLMS